MCELFDAEKEKNCLGLDSRSSAKKVIYREAACTSATADALSYSRRVDSQTKDADTGPTRDVAETANSSTFEENLRCYHVSTTNSFMLSFGDH